MIRPNLLFCDPSLVQASYDLRDYKKIYIYKVALPLSYILKLASFISSLTLRMLRFYSGRLKILYVGVQCRGFFFFFWVSPRCDLGWILVPDQIRIGRNSSKTWAFMGCNNQGKTPRSCLLVSVISPLGDDNNYLASLRVAPQWAFSFCFPFCLALGNFVNCKILLRT